MKLIEQCNFLQNNLIQINFPFFNGKTTEDKRAKQKKKKKLAKKMHQQQPVVCPLWRVSHICRMKGTEIP